MLRGSPPARINGDVATLWGDSPATRRGGKEAAGSPSVGQPDVRESDRHQRGFLPIIRLDPSLAIGAQVLPRLRQNQDPPNRKAHSSSQPHAITRRPPGRPQNSKQKRKAAAKHPLSISCTLSSAAKDQGYETRQTNTRHGRKGGASHTPFLPDREVHTLPPTTRKGKATGSPSEHES